MHQTLEPAATTALGMTAAQRLHMEVFGYVLIEQALDPQLVERLLAKLYGFERQYRRGEPLPPRVRLGESRMDYFRIDNVAHIDPDFLAYIADPRLMAMAGEVVGSDVRLVQSDAHIRRSGSASYRHFFHRDNRQDLAVIGNGMYHHPFIKTLTMLTDVGPDDGGTCVIPGSHKLSADLDAEDVIAAAEADPRLIHQVVAKAGTTLLFFESLLHTSGINRSGRDRALVIGGYVPEWQQGNYLNDLPPEFVAASPERVRRLLEGAPEGSPAEPRYATFPRRQPVVPIPPDVGADPWVDHRNIRIVRAVFGADGKTVDVMHLVRRIASGQQLLISFLTAGDPMPQVYKTTELEWITAAGERRRRTFEEGEVIHLDELVEQTIECWSASPTKATSAN